MGLQKPESLEIILKDIIRKVERDNDSRFRVFNRERNVEDKLIRPILETLGWDFTSMNIVRQVWPYSGKRPDFYFVAPDQTELIVEAKYVGDAIPQKNEKQLANYIHHVRFLILTDGIDWFLFDGKISDVIQDCRFWHCNLLVDPFDFCVQLISGLYFSEKISERIANCEAKARYQCENLFEEYMEKFMNEVDIRRILQDRLQESLLKRFASHYSESEYYIDDFVWNVGYDRISEFIKELGEDGD